MPTPTDTPFDLGPKGLSLQIKLTPNSRANRIDGIEVSEDGPVLKIRVTAVPEKGKANKALIKLLTKETGVAGSRFEVVSGTTSRKKRLNIADDDNALLSQLVEWSKTLSAKN
ncbi:MAG: DUF167 domain-containing protein [Alphaproteobacteria bacterium]|jgi:uncharacterized protein (TIGR00251 family)|nr:DUF167 domain-containing protein [Alphaproteobacteria bacterium]MBT4020068.1 DUF167 domain-containing protein [Alphaproteobacteria bacterium]MBT5159871.1 DUF167 domain-containing protein [Alphaproteobacteria bacterium]MBT5918971.1 DUF167 domain-containing protein [Alphaproteobacteria bacterium]MBT6386554.1 DUF167 domain-containing protein [Alphaproteobacteria bacterium]